MQLTPAMMVQLFWMGQYVGLFICCMLEQVDPNELAAKKSGKRSKVQADVDSPDLVSSDSFVLSPITAFTQGVLVSLLATAITFVFVKIFHLGNRRFRKKTRGLRTQAQGVIGQLRHVCSVVRNRAVFRRASGGTDNLTEITQLEQSNKPPDRPPEVQSMSRDDVSNVPMSNEEPQAGEAVGLSVEDLKVKVCAQ